MDKVKVFEMSVKKLKNNYKILLGAFLCILWILPIRGHASEIDDASLPMAGQETSAIMITDATGLAAMEKDPYGNYELAADVDASGVDWFPMSFHGNLNGNGYSILNLTIRDAGESIRETFDGNMKVYDTYFAGLFDELSEGSVSNLHLVNVRIKVETDQPCFIGGIAGYMENGTIENCSVQGTLELWAHDRMFGVGGIIGYGCGTVKDCNADVTLICVDTDATTKDEQFMGGVCAAGYPDMTGNVINIRGYDSDHGYVHDGGLVGMYMFYPKGKTYRGTITDNYVSGKITFFEDNKNRRAYCTGFIGEIMNWDFENGRNKNDFERDEVFRYDVNLLPHACDNPVMREEVVLPSCEFGYMRYVCETCGYSETDHYTLKQHAFAWTVVKEPTEKEEGLREGICENCGAVTSESIPVIIPQPTETPKAPETAKDEREMADETPALCPDAEESDAGSFPVLWLAGLAVALVGAAGGALWMIRRGRK